MSLSFQKLEPIEVKMPQMILNNKRDYAVLCGPKQTTLKQWTSTSISNSNITFTMPPPSPSAVVDRRMYLYVPFRLTFTGTSTAVGQTLLNLNQDAPRAFPLSSAIDTLTSTINQTAVTVNLADVIQPLLRYNTDNLLKNHLYSTSFSYPDQAYYYSTLNGSIRNPFAGYGDSTDENVQSRGGHANYTIVSNPVSISIGQPLTAVADMCACEPLFCLSPYYWGAKETSGFVHVNSMDLTVNFLSQAANRLWSRSETAPPVQISYALGNTPNGPTSFTNTTKNVPYVLVTYYTPPETQIIPREMPITYPFFEVQRFATDVGVIPAHTQYTGLVSNAIQLMTIPRRVYIFLRQRNQDLYSSCTNADCFLQISNINITFQNQNGIFSSGNMLQLYQTSQKNHCSLSWTQWSGGPVYNGSFGTILPTVGSIFCAEFGTDIPLMSELDAPGKICNTNFQVTVSGTNLANENLNVTMYVIPVLEGTFTIEGIGRCSQNIGVLTSQDILDAKAKPYLNYNDVQEVNGGDFFSGMKDFFGKVNNFLKDNKVISSLMTAFPPTKPFSRLVKNFGYGDEEGGVVLDEFGGEEEEGGVRAGRSLPRNQLKRGMRKRLM